RRFIRRVVQNLDVEPFFGIVDFADRLHQSVHYELLVVNRQLDGDARKLGKLRRRLRGAVPAVPVIHVNQRIPVQAVGRENDHHHEIGDQQRQIEGVGGIKAAKGLIQKLALEIVDQPPLRMGKEQQRETGEEVQIHAPKMANKG